MTEDHAIQGLLDIIEREIRYNEEFAPQRAEWMQTALQQIVEGLNPRPDAFPDWPGDDGGTP